MLRSEPTMFSRRFLIHCAQVWIGLIIIGSFLPGEVKIAIGTTTGPRASAAVRVRTSLEHRLVHVAEFGIAAVLLSVVSVRTRQRVWFALALAGLGLALEWLEHLAGRGVLEWWDVRDDTYGVCLGSVLGAWHLVRKKLLREPSRLTRA